MSIGRKRSESGGSSNIASKLIEQVGTLFSNFNKTGDIQSGSTQGIVGSLEPELSLEISDEELIKMKSRWETEFSRYSGKIRKRQKENKQYWLGKHYGNETKQYNVVDNLVFESLETLLPLVTRQLPTPLVLADNSNEGAQLSTSVAKMLSFLVDQEKLKIKIKQSVRNWALYFIGSLKVTWDFVEDEIRICVVSPEDLILDPRGFFDGAEFTGRYIGEMKTDDASTLVQKFPDSEEFIRELVDGNMGTELKYTEWWTNKFVFWTLQNIVLDKRQNPHWNYSEEREVMDQFGNISTEEIDAKNHFNEAKMPYSFMWAFNTGCQPHDETSLIEQVKTLQDVLNKRTRQIDKNADDTNNGWVLNNQFDQDSANRALNALKRGGAIIAPTSDISQSVKRMQAPPLANYVFEDIFDKRNQIRNIMGVRGSTAQGIMGERTVRGKIEIKGQDIDRLSLIVEHIEQMVDYLFNYMVQMMYVYYDREHVASIIGEDKGIEYIELKKEIMDQKLLVSVKEGSMIPQDPLLRRNEAIDLFQAGILDPVTLFERLDFPKPKEAAEKAVAFKTNPQSLFEEQGQELPDEISQELGTNINNPLSI